MEEYILKSAALSSTLMCPAYTDIHHEAAPIVRVAVYPRSLGMHVFYHLIRLCLKLVDHSAMSLKGVTEGHFIIRGSKQMRRVSFRNDANSRQ